MQAVINHLPPSNITSHSDEHTLQLSFECLSIIGVYHNERTNSQKIIIIINIKAQEKWDASHRAAVKEIALGIAQLSHPMLLEKMVFDLKEALIKQWPTIIHAHLIIKKPEALHYARCSYVELIVERRPT